MRTDKGFVEHATWEKNDEKDDHVLELTINEFALKVEGDPNQLTFDVYDVTRSQRP